MRRTPHHRNGPVAEFPIGCGVNGGEFIITEHLYGEPEAGIFRGRVGGAPDGQAVLITTGTAQADVFAAVFERLEFDGIDGVSELLCINRLDTDELRRDAMVEVEPEGQPISSLVGTLSPPSVLSVGSQLAQLLSDAEFLDEAMVGLRPELIYVDAGADEVAFTGTAPRSALFWAGMKPTSIGVPPCFDVSYLAPEVLAVKPVHIAADLFSVCAMLAEWASGQYPFTTPPPSPLLAPLLGTRVPWTGPRELGAVLDRGLDKDPEGRINVDDLIAALAKLQPV